MKTVFKRSFIKDLRSVDKPLRLRVQQVIEEVEAAESLRAIGNVTKMTSRGPYYRIRVGDYRVGVSLRDGAVTFVRFLHRKDIYRYFP